MNESLLKQINDIQLAQTQNAYNLKLIRDEICALREDLTKAEEARLQERLMWEKRVQESEKRFQEIEKNIQQLQRR